MSKVEEIESAIKGLTPEEWSALREWFAEQDAAKWDAEFEDDVQNGRLDALADKAIADVVAGQFREL